MPLPLEFAQRRYIQQAEWTRPLRQYLLKRAGVSQAKRILEVGCGTGAVLSELSAPEVHGLDIDAAALRLARIAAPAAHLTAGDAHQLPYDKHSFDIVCFHYVLLWLAYPVAALKEAARVARPGGAILAFAEPDYTQRTDTAAFAEVGRLQTQALREQGADPAIGSRLPALFTAANLHIRESGPLESAPAEFNEVELEVLRNDLGTAMPDSQWEELAKQLTQSDARFLVPTYFAWATSSTI